jgi:hypothetical protein
MPATRAANTTKAANDLTGALRDYAEASISDTQALASAGLAYAQTATESALVQGRQWAESVAATTLASVERTQKASVDTWKLVADTAVTGPVTRGLPGYGEASVQEAVIAGFDLAKGMLDTQRQLVERFVGGLTVA